MRKLTKTTVRDDHQRHKTCHSQGSFIYGEDQDRLGRVRNVIASQLIEWPLRILVQLSFEPVTKVWFPP